VPVGVAVGPTGNVFVADAGENRVQKLAPNGRLLAEWGATAGDSGTGGLFFPYGLVVGADRNLYVADRGNNRIVKLSTTGLWRGSWPMPRAERNLSEMPDPVIMWRFNWLMSGLASYLAGLALDRHGAVFATRPGQSYGASNRGALLQYSRAGTLLNSWRDQTWNLDADGPYGVAVNANGTIYVRDEKGIIELSPSYKVLQRLPHLSGGALATDGQGNIYVANSHDLQLPPLEKVSPSGRVLGKWGWGIGQAGAVTLDRRGNIYVTDAAQDRIVKLSSTGRVLACWGGSGSEPGLFHHPFGIAVDATGNLYVADTGNNRIQKLIVGRQVDYMHAPPDLCFHHATGAQRS
jgi:tripartite motif-containing protein 71